MIDTSESLTLRYEAGTRAAHALAEALKDGCGRHSCAEWQEDGVCRVCWDIAAEVIRAAEGLRLCSRCRGGGRVPPGDCCPECGGNGLEEIPNSVLPPTAPARSALLCLLVGHEAPRADEDPTRCRRPGCSALWPISTPLADGR